MNKRKAQLIVALDVDSLQEAEALVKILSPVVDIYKVGSQLFTAEGPRSVWSLRDQGKRVFLDLKFYDIPQTVSFSTSGAIVMSVGNQISPNTQLPGLFMFTVHTQGGRIMLE